MDTVNASDHWWSRKPKDERRRLLSVSRLLWNTLEFRHPWTVALILGGSGFVVLMVASIVIAVLYADNGRLAETAPVDVTEPVLSLYVDMSQVDPAIGTRPPELVGSSFDGRPVSIRNDDKAKVIAFLAHWDPHSEEALQILRGWLADSNQPPFDLYVVSTAVSPVRENYPPSVWLRDVHDVPVLADDSEGTAGTAFGVGGLPTWVFVGSDNMVVHRIVGHHPSAIEQLRTELR